MSLYVGELRVWGPLQASSPSPWSHCPCGLTPSTHLEWAWGVTGTSDLAELGRPQGPVLDLPPAREEISAVTEDLGEELWWPWPRVVLARGGPGWSWPAEAAVGAGASVHMATWG